MTAGMSRRLAQRVPALHGLECRANIHRRNDFAISDDGHLAAVCSIDGETTTGGNGVGGTPGVPIRPANQGSAVANARAANGQSCLPG